MVNEDKVRKYMSEKDIDAFFIAKQVNVRFTSGWTGDDSYILLTADNKFFLTDARYTEQAELELPTYEILNWRTDNRTVGDTVKELVDKYDIKNIAFESDYFTFDFYDDFNNKTNAELVAAGDVIDRMRVVKSPEEIEYSRKACQIACRAFERIVDDIHVGMTEKELANLLSLYMVEEGADNQPYGNILISGKKTSLLHGIPDNKAIEYGDLVLLDFGCQYNGYMSDMTRTVVVGEPTEKQKEVYEYVKQSLHAAEDAIKAGANYKDIYPKSLEPLKGTEYGPLTYNRIGHSIGLFVHELPLISEEYNETIEENTVLTVEPGIYIPNWGGVRIEDQILVTKDGFENMTDVTHDLIIL